MWEPLLRAIHASGSSAPKVFHATRRASPHGSYRNREEPGKGRVQQTVQFDQRLVIKNNGIEICRRQNRLIQAKNKGLQGKGQGILRPAETLFLGGGDRHTVHEQSGGTVVIKR